ncbi:(Fe-S)-binding protein [Aquipuribacter nitratireducens]|uniref:(Fe-S)-binding protein n=1 Tax=Aquipuribacter nitratireducens TaxID=650104 RepID=A0ABW0GHW7_9MICO
MRIALFVTCLADTVAPEVGVATVRLLERLGHEVVFPPEQTCCGQMHVNSGYPAMALPLVRRYVETFERALGEGPDGGAEAVVVPSGSCTGSVRHQHADVAEQAGDTALAARARAVAARTFELSELLVDVLGVTDVGAWYPHRVTYHPTCHSLRMARVGDRPLQLLRAVGGIDLVELPGAEQCCGFGGTFAVKNADTSSAMLADKCSAICSTGAEVVSAGDASCLLHLGGGLSRLSTTRGDGTPRAVHLAEILASTRADRPERVTG